jgi:hypothetical protein
MKYQHNIPDIMQAARNILPIIVIILEMLRAGLTEEEMEGHLV